MLSGKREIGPLVVALITVLLLVSTAAGPVVAMQESTDEDEDSDEVEAADEVFITENGAILVYENDTVSKETVAMNYGADVATGLVNGVVETNGTDSENVTGTIGMEARENSLAGNANISLQNTEDIGEFTFTANGEHTSTDSYFNSSFEGVVETQQSSMTGETSGEFVATGDQVSFTSDVVQGETPTGDDVTQKYDLTIRQNDDGFDVSAEQKQEVYFAPERWDSRENATRTLEAQFEGVAMQFNGSADVSLDSYSYEPATSDSPATVDVAYTVEIQNVREEMNRLLVEEVVSDEAFNISDEEAADLTESMDDVEITEVSVSYVQGTEGNMAGSATVVLSNYQDPVLTYMDAVAEEDGALTAEQVTKTEEAFEAQSASDLRQELSWDATVEPGEEAGMSKITASVSYDTENWEAYVEEKYGDDTANRTEASFDIDVESDGETVDANMTFHVNREDFMDEAVSQGVDALKAESSGDLDEEEMEFLNAFDESDINVAKTDIAFNNETVEVRAAGQFDNLSAFEGTQDDLPASSSITHMYGEVDNDTSKSYVYVEDENMTAESIKETPLADENTTIHAEGEWDREFPKMDTVEVKNYLGIEKDEENPDGDSEDNGGLPVVPLAIGGGAVALAGAAAFYHYRL